jgi:hypothetical protein
VQREGGLRAAFSVVSGLEFPRLVHDSYGKAGLKKSVKPEMPDRHSSGDGIGVAFLSACCTEYGIL